MVHLHEMTDDGSWRQIGSFSPQNMKLCKSPLSRKFMEFLFTNPGVKTIQWTTEDGVVARITL